MTNFCCICYEILDVQCTILTCHSNFHTNCLQTWLTFNSSCPMCRKTFVKPNPNLETIVINNCIVTPTKYNIGQCTNHNIQISKPYGVLIECKTCAKIYSFNWIG